MGNTKSPLAEKVDCVLDASVSGEADPLIIVPTANLLCVLPFACDSIFSNEKERLQENDATHEHTPADNLEET